MAVTGMIRSSERRLHEKVIVHIELTSTLTQEDENRLAAVVLKVLSGMLDMLPISYLVRVETTDQSVIEQVSPGLSGWDASSLAADTSSLSPSRIARARTAVRYPLSYSCQ